MSYEPPPTITLRFCAECGRFDDNYVLADEHVASADLLNCRCPGTVQTLTYTLDEDDKV